MSVCAPRLVAQNREHPNGTLTAVGDEPRLNCLRWRFSLPPQPDEYQKKKRNNDRRCEPKSLHSGKGGVVVHRKRNSGQENMLPRYDGEDDRQNKNSFDHLVHRGFYTQLNMRGLRHFVHVALH
jgi:hypothetical protein